MNFFLQATEYLCALKDKGYYDADFMIEYEFLCLETYKIRNPKALEEINNLQAKKLLCTEALK